MIKKNGGIFGRNPTYNDVVVEGVLTLKEAQVFDNDITINGDLTVNGTGTVINTVELNVDDKNITMGAVVAKVGLAATTNITAGQFTVQLADTSGLIPGMTVTKTSGTGAFGASPKIASVDSHTQITLTVAHATSGTIIFDTGGATDDTADGGGITLKGTTDKFIKWVKANLAWVFSDPIKAPDITVDNLTASKPVFTDANKKLTSTGTLAIDQGGTGQTTQQAAINALAGAVTAAQFLRGDGTDVKMSAIQASDVPTLNQNTTGNAATATTATTALNLKSNSTTGVIQVAGPGAGTTRVMTTPDASFTVARTDAAQTFSGVQTLSMADNTNGFIARYLSGTNNPGLFVKAVEAAAEVYVASASSTGADNLVLGPSSMSGKTLALKSDGKVYSYGNIVMANAGEGIDFSVTSQATGMTSELLSDYEEGTWTPSLVPGTSGSISLSAANGRYTKIGNMVTVTAVVVSNGVTSPVGELRLAGLPFAVGGNGGGSFAPFAYGLASAATTSLAGNPSATNTYAVISKYAAGTVSNLAQDVQNGTGMYISFMYLV